MDDAVHAQSHVAAMMWQQQQQYAAQALMMPPWPAPSPNLDQAMLYVVVEGLKFGYQLTKDDVHKLFSRYGEVMRVEVNREGTAATVIFRNYSHAVAAQFHLDGKELAKMSDAHLCVEFAPQGFDPMFAQMAAAGAAQSCAAPQMYPTSGYPSMFLPAPNPDSSDSGRSKKYTCKLEIGVENEGEFRVGSRVIQIARQIWQRPCFQEAGGKTRMRGKGAGGQHEVNKPLALYISCQDQAIFDEAVQYAEAQLLRVHNDYKVFCQEKGMDVREFSLKISKRGIGSDSPRVSGADPPLSERPASTLENDEITRLIEERNEARKVGNFKKSDEIRDNLKARGVVLMDEKGAKFNLKGNDVTKWRMWWP